MRPISEVLRLAAEEAGLSWPLPADLDEAALEARLFRAGELRGEPRSGRPEPDWEEV